MRNPSAFAWVLVTLLLVVTGEVARADDRGTAFPRAASHVGRIEGGGVTWTSRFVGSTTTESPGEPPRWERIDLAGRVSGSVDRDRSPGVVAVLREGAIVAFDVDTRLAPGWHEELSVVLHEHAERSGEGTTLSPPLAAGGGVQRIEVSGEKDLRFEPDSSLGFVHEVGAWCTPGVSDGARHETDVLLGGRDTALDEAPIYVEASSPALREGLRGRALTGEERARPGMILAVVVFLLLAAGCLVAYRRLAGDARVEQAEAAIREDFEREATER